MIQERDPVKTQRGGKGYSEFSNSSLRSQHSNFAFGKYLQAETHL